MDGTRQSEHHCPVILNLCQIISLQSMSYSRNPLPGMQKDGQSGEFHVWSVQEPRLKVPTLLRQTLFAKHMESFSQQKEKEELVVQGVSSLGVPLG